MQPTLHVKHNCKIKIKQKSSENAKIYKNHFGFFSHAQKQVLQLKEKTV